MSEPTALPEKLTKLLPLLASDRPGEVVATAAAIGRTLRAAGRDWHDLTAALTAGLRPERPNHLAMIRTVIGSDLEFTPWEQSFLTGAMKQLRRKGSLSPKQAETLVELYARAA